MAGSKPGSLLRRRLSIRMGGWMRAAFFEIPPKWNSDIPQANDLVKLVHKISRIRGIEVVFEGI